MSSQNMFYTPLIDTQEHHPALRDSVARLMSGFGRAYFQDIVRRGARAGDRVTPLASARALAEIQARVDAYWEGVAVR